MAVSVAEPLMPLPDPKEFDPIFGGLIKTATAVADCECKQHQLNHTQLGECNKRAEYRLTALWLLSPTLPLVYFLCPDCLQWHKNWLILTHPTIELAVTPLEKM